MSAPGDEHPENPGCELCVLSANGRCSDGQAGAPAIHYSEGFYKRLTDNLYDGVYFVDGQQRITYWNRGAENLTGYKASEVVGRRCSDNLLEHVDESGVLLCTAGCPLSRSMEDRVAREAEVYLRHKDGHRVPVSVRTGPIEDDQGNVIGAVEVFSDNSAKKSVQQRAYQLEQMAYLDVVTRVPNRRYLEIRLRQALEEARRYHHEFGLMIVDVDDFKRVNDRYGHAAGDQVLIAIARTLAECLRSSDQVGRWGGDEFLGILTQATNDNLRMLTERCRALAENARVSLAEGNVQVTVSIGATLVRPSDSVESVLQRADGMLYQSKVRGRNTITID